MFFAIQLGCGQCRSDLIIGFLINFLEELTILIFWLGIRDLPGCKPFGINRVIICPLQKYLLSWKPWLFLLSSGIFSENLMIYCESQTTIMSNISAMLTLIFLNKCRLIQTERWIWILEHRRNIGSCVGC